MGAAMLEIGLILKSVVSMGKIHVQIEWVKRC